MATYKDPANLTFKPYVEQRPVEAMLKVGMYKQQKYDEGVQKIQESIDNIAGLDVVRPEDKEYLQSKLNQLGSQLSMVAGGDFSNFQLVNSVNGMTNQIVKDPNVLNAVANTTKYRKDLETVAELQKEGKWADSNQAAFNKDVNAWFNGGQDASYNANVSPYVDPMKDAMEIVKNLAKDYTDNPIMIGDNGEVLDVMTQQRIEGITPEKIAAALKTGLSPQAWRQLSIDGQYKYSNVSPDQFVNDINNTYQETFSLYSSRRDSLMQDANSASTQMQKDQIMAQVRMMDRQIESLKNEYNSVSSGFANGDVESAKAQYYTMNWLENTSNVMSSRGESNTPKVSPAYTVEMRDKEFALSMARFEETLRHNSEMEGYENRKAMAAEALAFPFGTGVAIPEPSQNPRATIDAMIANVEADGMKIEAQKQKLASTFGWDTTVKLQPALDSKGNPILDPSTGKPKMVMSSQADIQIQKIIEADPGTVDPTQYKLVKQYYDQQKSFDQRRNQINVASEEAQKQVPMPDIMAQVPEEYKNRTWQGYSAPETINLMRRFYSIQNRGQSLGDPAAMALAREELNDREFDMYRYVFKGNTAVAGNNPDARTAMLMMKYVDNTINDVNKRRSEIMADLLYQSTTTEQRTSVPILLDKPAIKAGAESMIGDIEMVLNQGGWPGLEGDPKSMASTISSIKEDLTDARFITKDKALNIQGGGESITIPLTDEQWNKYTGRYKAQVEPSNEARGFTLDILPQMLVTNPSLTEKNFYTTALPDEDGKSSLQTNFTNAFFRNMDFPSIQHYNVSANFVTTENPREDFEDGYWYINVSNIDAVDRESGVKVNGQVMWNVAYPFSMTKEQAFEFKQTVTDKTIYDLIVRQFPNLIITPPPVKQK